MKIEYTKYNFNPPNRISKDIYYNIKNKIIKFEKNLNYSFTPFRDYGRDILFLIISPSFIIASIFFLKQEVFLQILGLLFLYPFISSVLSIPSMISFQIDKKNYYKKIYYDLCNTKDYESFINLQNSHGIILKEDFQIVKNSYSNFTNNELIKLYLKKNELQPVFFKIFEEEFDKRGLYKGIEFNYEKNPFKLLNSKKEIKKLLNID